MLKSGWSATAPSVEILRNYHVGVTYLRTSFRQLDRFALKVQSHVGVKHRVVMRVKETKVYLCLSRSHYDAQFDARMGWHPKIVKYVRNTRKKRHVIYFKLFTSTSLRVPSTDLYSRHLYSGWFHRSVWRQYTRSMQHSCELVFINAVVTLIN